MATTYLTPGVYVEEVPSGSATLAPGATAVAAFVGFTARRRTDDPNDPHGLKPRLVTSWTQFEHLYGGFTPGAMLPHSVYGYFNNGGSARLHRAASRTPSRPPSPARWRCRPPTARSARPSRSRPSSPTPTSPSRSPPSRRPRTTRRPRRRSASTSSRRRQRARRDLRRPHARQGRPQRRDRRQQGVDEDQGGDEDRHLEARGRPGQPARRQLRARAGPADARRRHRPGVRRLRDRPHRASTASSSPTTSRW